MSKCPKHKCEIHTIISLPYFYKHSTVTVIDFCYFERMICHPVQFSQKKLIAVTHIVTVSWKEEVVLLSVLCV